MILQPPTSSGALLRAKNTHMTKRVQPADFCNSLEALSSKKCTVICINQIEGPLVIIELPDVAVDCAMLTAVLQRRGPWKEKWG